MNKKVIIAACLAALGVLTIFAVKHKSQDNEEI